MCHNYWIFHIILTNVLCHCNLVMLYAIFYCNIFFLCYVCMNVRTTGVLPDIKCIYLSIYISIYLCIYLYISVCLLPASKYKCKCLEIQEIFYVNDLGIWACSDSAVVSAPLQTSWFWVRSRLIPMFGGCFRLRCCRCEAKRTTDSLKLINQLNGWSNIRYGQPSVFNPVPRMKEIVICFFNNPSITLASRRNASILYWQLDLTFSDMALDDWLTLVLDSFRYTGLWGYFRGK